jgi:hypothetical protein
VDLLIAGAVPECPLTKQRRGISLFTAMRSLAVEKGDRCFGGLGKLTATSRVWGSNSGAIAMTVHFVRPSRALAERHRVTALIVKKQLHWIRTFSSAGQWLKFKPYGNVRP